ncbi:MAG: CehA/McbA family metallohydrolase [Chloroflexi bacterium]|nr:CehA/McbA family metallohydrolase [Chloroflexota bacterium]
MMILLSHNSNPFLLDGQWFKGNTHCHTTLSDGKREPGHAAQWYRANGYDFLAFTDHHNTAAASKAATDGLLVIPGIELDAIDPKIGEYHLVGLGVQAYAQPRQSDLPLQLAIDRVRDLNGLAVLAHPHWMGLRADDLLDVQGLTALEVFNTTCELINGKGLSDVLWDELLAEKKQLWGTAVDDTHWAERDDPGGGWLMVKAQEWTQAAILHAIARGHFWTTTGPELYKVWLDGKTVRVECSPVKIINFIAQGRHGSTERAEPTSLLTRASFELTGQEIFLRVEIIDEQGRRAWSNPFYLSSQVSQ